MDDATLKPPSAEDTALEIQSKCTACAMEEGDIPFDDLYLPVCKKLIQTHTDTHTAQLESLLDEAEKALVDWFSAVDAGNDGAREFHAEKELRATLARIAEYKKKVS